MNIFRVVFLICLNQLAIGEIIAQNSSVPDELPGDEPDMSNSDPLANCPVSTSWLNSVIYWTKPKDFLRVRFFLSSRIKRDRVEVLEDEKINIKVTDFKIERRTVVIVHGYLHNSSEQWIKEMEDAFLLWGDVNMVVVDWDIGENRVNYQVAVRKVDKIGNEVSRFLQRVVNAMIDATSPKKPNWGILHLIGHSLGAHICGIAGADFNTSQNHWQVTRITGMDPAGPCFVDTSVDQRLDLTDAKFVDVIHTSEASIFFSGYGLAEPIGHVDFYPNGGVYQPGCNKSLLEYIDQGICNHERAFNYFIESLKLHATNGACKFWAQPWNRSDSGALESLSDRCDPSICTEMGIGAENHSQKQGTFLLKTTGIAPFCIMEENSNEEHLSANRSANRSVNRSANPSANEVMMRHHNNTMHNSHMNVA